MVPACNAATLMPVIQRNIAPGTRIWSDECPAFSGLHNLGFLHETVRSSLHFTDPITGVHVNTIKARLAACKASFKCKGGIAHKYLSYIDEYVWRARHSGNVFGEIMTVIQQHYTIWLASTTNWLISEPTGSFQSHLQLQKWYMLVDCVYFQFCWYNYTNIALF